MNTITEQEKRVLLSLARFSVQAACSGGPPPPIPDSDVCKRAGGAFVTLKVNGRLRGCLGHFVGLGTLGDTVRSMAKQAAVSDFRFVPVSVEDVAKLTIEISILSQMKTILPEGVLPGTHGLYIRRGAHAGTLLPQVAEEEGWNSREFLQNTCLKAGLTCDTYLMEGTEILSYTAEVFSETTIGNEDRL